MNKLILIGNIVLNLYLLRRVIIEDNALQNINDGYEDLNGKVIKPSLSGSLNERVSLLDIRTQYLKDRVDETDDTALAALGTIRYNKLSEHELGRARSANLEELFND